MSEKHDEGLTRRDVIAAGVVGAATLASPAVGAAGKGETKRPAGARLPVVYLPHGGGPWPFVEMGFDPKELEPLASYLRGLRGLPKAAPKAVLAVSAHWEQPVPTVMTAERPPMLYDYYGFPPASYQIQWPAPGSPALANRVQALLEAADIPSAADPGRGFDHGTFVPLKLTYPDAEVPTIQLSLKAGLDPAEHLRIGRALAPLRDEGVFIVGSGMSFHNMRAFGDPRARAMSETFDAWLTGAATAAPAERDRQLAAWASAPAARLAHPREEHLLPLMVIAGAAGEDRGSAAFSGPVLGARVSAYHFG